MRTLIGVVTLLALFACTGESADKDKKKVEQTFTGKVFSVDPEGGFVTVIITAAAKKEKKTVDAKYKVNDDTTIILGQGKEVLGKEGLKDIKEGMIVTVALDKDSRTISITVGGAKK